MARDFRITFDVHLIDENDDTSITEINEFILFQLDMRPTVSMSNTLSELGLNELEPKNLKIELI